MLLLIPICAAPAVAVETGFINGTVEADGKTMPYVVFVPRSYTPKQKWPVILFLHGAGERGDDGCAQARVGIGPQLWRHTVGGLAPTIPGSSPDGVVRVPYATEYLFYQAQE